MSAIGMPIRQRRSLLTVFLNRRKSGCKVRSVTSADQGHIGQVRLLLTAWARKLTPQPISAKPCYDISSHDNSPKMPAL
jgi:hypothetical protein